MCFTSFFLSSLSLSRHPFDDDLDVKLRRFRATSSIMFTQLCLISATFCHLYPVVLAGSVSGTAYKFWIEFTPILEIGWRL